MRDIFQTIHDENLWGGAESSSGPGSSMQATAAIREALPPLLKKYDIQSILDVPCGDFNWMAGVLLGMPAFTYIGGDIVPDIIKKNKVLWPPSLTFIERDITVSLPMLADVVIVRDCLVHFSRGDIYAALGNIYKGGYEYLLMTNFSGDREFVDKPTGQWRPVNFTLPPFNMPRPLEVINECNSGHPDKELALWKLGDGMDKLKRRES